MLKARKSIKAELRKANALAKTLQDQVQQLETERATIRTTAESARDREFISSMGRAVRDCPLSAETVLVAGGIVSGRLILIHLLLGDLRKLAQLAGEGR